MKEYLIRSIVTALEYGVLTLVFDAIFWEVGSIWKYVIPGILFGIVYEGWWHFYRKGTFSKKKDRTEK